MGLVRKHKVFDKAYFNMAHISINPSDMRKIDITPEPAEGEEAGEKVFKEELPFTLNMWPHTTYEQRFSDPIDSRIGTVGVGVPGIKMNPDQLKRFQDLIYECAGDTDFFKEGVKK